MKSTSSSRRTSAPSHSPAKKRFGQHFLTDVSILNRIVDAAEISPGETVIEVGPGRGALTAPLAERGARVVAVEIDRDLIAPLKERFAGVSSVTVIETNVLDHTPGELLAMAGAPPPYVVVANLPYNVAAAILRRFLEAEERPARLVVMVQREVAEAIVAKPGQMSLLSLGVQVYAHANLVLRLPPGAFSPPPKVHSAVVRIDVAARPRVDAPVEAVFRVARAGFGKARKQLHNSLSIGLSMTPAETTELLRQAGIDPTRRAQTLSVNEWDAVARAWIERKRA